MEHISIKNICKKYGQGESSVKALDNVSLEIAKGEVCVILGPSGSGKSTLLNMIGGPGRVDSGSPEMNREPLYDFAIIVEKL